MAMIQVLATLIVTPVLLVMATDYTRTVRGAARRVGAIWGVYLGLLSLLLLGGFR